MKIRYLAVLIALAPLVAHAANEHANHGNHTATTMQSSEGGVGNNSPSSRSSTVTASGRTRCPDPLTAVRASLAAKPAERSTMLLASPGPPPAHQPIALPPRCAHYRLPRFP